MTAFGGRFASQAACVNLPASTTGGIAMSRLAAAAAIDDASVDELKACSGGS